MRKKMITVYIPESITGVSRSCDLSIADNYKETLTFLTPIFFNDSIKGAIRVSKDRPKNERSMIVIEMWQFNQELTKFDWQGLTIDTATLLLANYGLLRIEEKMYFQPLLWSYFLHSYSWNSVLSNGILSFSHEDYATTKTLRDICTAEQKKIIVICLSQLFEKLSSNSESTTFFEHGLDPMEEIQRVSKVIEIWRRLVPANA